MAQKKNKAVDTVWVIAYVDCDQIQKTETNLRKYSEYNDVVAFIPTVTILKKTFKQKNIFDEVPLLFNYGFFKVNKKYLRSSEYFEKLKERVPSIYQWVKDISCSKTLEHRFKYKDPEKQSKRKKEYVKLAIALPEEIESLKKEVLKTTIYDAKDIANLKVGNTIRLMGYPFEDMDALVLEINTKKEEIKIELMIGTNSKVTTVSFHNVFYTIYRDHKVGAMKEKSIEELKYKGKNIGDRF